jgi:hypothetical protein
MAGGWSARRADDLDDIDAWMSRRNADVALRPQADAFARDLWNQGTQNGDNLSAPQPSDLTAIGLAALTGGGVGPTGTVKIGGSGGNGSNDDADRPDLMAGSEGGSTNQSTGPYGAANDSGQEPNPSLGIGPNQQQHVLGGEPPGPNPSATGTTAPWVDELEVDAPAYPKMAPPDGGGGWERNPAIKALGGTVGFVGGALVGPLRSLYHAAGDLKDAALFAGKLTNPFDAEGRAEAANQARDEIHGALQYGRSVVANPGRLVGDAAAAGKATVQSMNPFSGPPADTAWDEMQHEFGIGMNAGEAAANVAGFFGGGEAIAGLRAVRAFEATREANIAKSMAQGLDRETAEYLSKSYEGMGHHAIIPQRFETISSEKWGIPIPAALEGKKIPKWIMDSPLNVSKPRGMSQGDFYDYHYGVDGKFHGARLPAGLNDGKGWSGKRLNQERYSLPQRLWDGTPTFWKDAAGIVDAAKVPGLFDDQDRGAPQ